MLGFGWGYCPLVRVRRKDGEREWARMSFGAMYAAVPTEPRVARHTFQSILTDINWMWSAAIQCYPFSGRRGFIYAGNWMLHSVEFGFIGAGMLVRCNRWNRCSGNPGMGSWHGSRSAVDHLLHWRTIEKSIHEWEPILISAWEPSFKSERRWHVTDGWRLRIAIVPLDDAWNDTWTTISVTKSTYGSRRWHHGLCETWTTGIPLLSQL